MAGAHIKVEGLDELRRVIRRIADKELADQLKRSNKSAADLVVRVALPHVPVRTGKLKASVRALGSQKVGRASAGGARVPYAGAVHWGRKRGNVGSPPGNRRAENVVKAKPFLRDAAKKAEPQIVDQYRRDVMAVMAAIERTVQ